MALRKTLLELRTAVRTNLDEASASFWTNQNLNQFLNRAKDRCWLEVKKVDQDYFAITRGSVDGVQPILGESYDCVNFRLAAGVRDLTLPPDFGELLSNRVVTAGYEWLRLAFRRHTDDEFRTALEQTDHSTPRFYTLLGERTARIAPRPDTALDWALTYTPIVPDLTTDTSTLELPHPLYMAVEQYATAEALMMDRHPDAAAWEAKGNATLALFFGANRRQRTDVEFVQTYGDW